ncbi:MAG: response regulator [Planctomycetes bacterium]|nr:response regulator [Planctomycetota bacterium]MCW8135730.1 response regulator [Planctomycetota bacterium]
MAVRRKSLSTGDIARYCQVTPATVVNWIKANKLEVYTTPGGQYRMEVEAFLKFLDKNRFPVPEDLAPAKERRILVVDDDPEILERATEALGELLPNVVIEESGDGYDALLKIGSFKPHAVVLDLMMARLDGAEVCRRLRANSDTRNMFIVAMSGLAADSDLVRKVKRIGVDGFFTKPLDYAELAKAVGKLLKVPTV